MIELPKEVGELSRVVEREFLEDIISLVFVIWLKRDILLVKSS